MYEEIRNQVAETYTKQVEGTKGACGTANAERIGYSRGELDAIPEDAAASSFGCGNPLAFAGVREGDTVIDLGSGAGIDVLIAAGRVGPSGHVIGIDMTDAMIERARANIAAAGAGNAEIRKGLIEDLPVDSGSVDWVISNCVINLSPEKPRVFAEIARVLKPGGRFSISDMVAEGMPDWVLQQVGLYSACVAGAISEQGYLRSLRAAGLADLEVTDRLVYDAAQIQALIESGELPVPKDVPAGFVARTVAALDGKVQSIKVVGRKP